MSYCAHPDCSKPLTPSYWQQCLPQVFPRPTAIQSQCCQRSYCSQACQAASICEQGWCRYCKKVFLGESILVDSQFLRELDQMPKEPNSKLPLTQYVITPGTPLFYKCQQKLHPYTRGKDTILRLQGGGSISSTLNTEKTPLTHGWSINSPATATLSKREMMQQSCDTWCLPCCPSAADYAEKSNRNGWLDASLSIKGDLCLINCARFFPQCMCCLIYKSLECLGKPTQQCIQLCHHDKCPKCCTKCCTISVGEVAAKEHYSPPRHCIHCGSGDRGCASVAYGCYPLYLCFFIHNIYYFFCPYTIEQDN